MNSGRDMMKEKAGQRLGIKEVRKIETMIKIREGVCWVWKMRDD